MRLGLAVGRVDIDRMLSQIPYHEWSEWLEFLAREPIGPAAWDARIGWILAVLVQAITGQKVNPKDFTPQWQTAERMDWRVMRSRFLAWRDAHADHR